MPALYAHYIFGKRVYAALPASEKRIIKKGKDAFLLGLHGPDLLFYYYPVCKNRINQSGVQMHKELAADFFEKGRMLFKEDKDPVLRAYLYGFLCHFILDSECHSYINSYIKEHDVGHLAIETEFDRYLMKLGGHDPLTYIPVHHLISRVHTRRQISRILGTVSPGQVGACIRTFRRVITFFICRKPEKRWLLRRLSKVAGQDRQIGGLIMDGQVHPECRESNRFLMRRLGLSVRLASEEIQKYSHAMDEGGLLSVRLYRNYEEEEN